MLLLELGHVDAASLEKVDHTLIGGAEFIRDVAGNGGGDQFPVGLGHEFQRLDRQHLLVLILFDVKLDVLAGPDPGHLHLVESQGTGLIGADVSGTAHDFTGSEFLDVVGVLEHLALRVGEGDHHSKGEAFGNSHDDNGDTDDDVVDPEFEVLGEGSFLGAGLTTEKIDVALKEAIKEVTEEKDVHGQEGSVGTDLSDLSGDELKLLLEGSGLGSHFELLHDLTKGGVLTDHERDHLAFS